MVGESAVGKSSLLLRFSEGAFEELSPTIGVDFRLKTIALEGKNVKLSLWDTAGQERFRTITASYYRGAHGVVFVFDVTRRETLDALQETWMKEFDTFSTIPDAVRMIVANKTDLEAARQVTRAEGLDFARAHGCLYVESSAKSDIGVTECFEELVRKILETPGLLSEGSTAPGSRVKVAAGPGQPAAAGGFGACCG